MDKKTVFQWIFLLFCCFIMRNPTSGYVEKIGVFLALVGMLVTMVTKFPIIVAIAGSLIVGGGAFIIGHKVAQIILK